MDTQKQESSVKLRLILRAGTAVTKWKKLAGRTKDRYYRLRQLVTTEEDYRKDLISIKDRIKQPLLDSQCITENDVARMFPNVESMIGLSVQLYQELKKKFQQWDSRKTMIGQTMIRFSKFLLVYSDYFKNFNETQRKLKQLLSENSGARLIEKKLSTENRIITFQDLMSKPFQRPLKYHLILRDYASKIDKNHPDYKHLQEAIECYHKVNQQNNLSLENKEKDQMLVLLDSRFGGIIEAQARYFVKQYEAVYIDNACTLYILSDMAILAYKNTNNCLKIALDKYSYVQRAPNGRYFVNRIFLFGRSLCVHLSFFDSATADEVYVTLSKLIRDTNKNEANREQMIMNRTTRASQVERRRSYTNLLPQFKRPLIIRVLGCEKRMFSSETFQSWFVIQFQATPPKVDGPSPPKQISYVKFQSLLQIESMGRQFYKEEQFYNIFPLLSRTKDMTQYEYKKNDGKRLQVQSLFITLFLNSIYRNTKILKRIDFPSFLLKLSEPLWLHLNEHYECACSSCVQLDENNKPIARAEYKTFADYFKELDDRYLSKGKLISSQLGKKKVFFCDVRTITMQQMYSSVSPWQLAEGGANSKARIAWVKAKLGWINHAYTTPKPISKTTTLDVFLCKVDGQDCCVRLDVYSNWRVRQVVDLAARRLGQQLQDYTLAVSLNGKLHLLLDDQIIGDALTPPKEEGGIISFFFKSDQYPPKLYLRKVWTLQYELQRAQEGGKLVLSVQQIIYRLCNEEIRLSMEQSIAVYAFFFAYENFNGLNMLTLHNLRMRSDDFGKKIPPSLKGGSFYDQMFRIIDRLKQDTTLMNTRMIIERIIEFLNSKPGWSCHLFQGLLQGYGKDNEGLQVRVGCDMEGLKVLEKNKVLPFLNFRLDDTNWNMAVIGFEVIIRDDKQEYFLFGRDLWKVKAQMDFYRLYREAFPRGKKS